MLGVVIAFRPPAKSRGKDFSCSLELVDESEKKIKFVAFGTASSLPQQCPLGSIVCLRKVEVVEFRGRSQLQAHSRLCTWAVLSERSDGSLCVASSNDPQLSLNEAERQRGRTLRAWVSHTNIIPGERYLYSC